METPPRLWGRLVSPLAHDERHQKHPHACGEDLRRELHLHHRHRNTPTPVGKTSSRPVTPATKLETPPRLWGRRRGLSPLSTEARNTPTPVGKTPIFDFVIAMLLETPPRLWGRPEGCSHFLVCIQKHPHACGEDLDAKQMRSLVRETPPRLWGRPGRRRVPQGAQGNTPTPVGKTEIPTANWSP